MQMLKMFDIVSVTFFLQKDIHVNDTEFQYSHEYGIKRQLRIGEHFMYMLLKMTKVNDQYCLTFRLK